MESSKPWLHKIRSSESFVVLVVSIAIFTDVFIYGMVVPIIPIALVDRVGTRPEDAQSWVSILLAVYGATLLVGSPLFGYFADHSRYRRLPFIIGLIALGTSTLLFVLARSIELLIIARGLQGLSAAAVWVVGLAIIADNVPSEHVGEAMGQTTIALTWGFLLGPIVGGVMYEKLGFLGTFAVPTGLIVLDVILRFAMIEAPRTVQDKIEQTSTSTSTPVPGSNSITDSYNTFSDHDESVRAGTGNSPSTHYNEHSSLLRPSSAPYTDHHNSDSNNHNHTHKPTTILHLFRYPRLPLACIATIVMAITLAALETTIPLYVMETFNWTSSGAGLIFIFTSLPSFAGIYIGRLTSRIGVRIPAASAFTSASLVWFLMRLVNQNSITHIIALALLLFVIGFATVTVEIASMTEASQVVTDYEDEFPGAFGEKSPVAQAYALFNMAFAGGQLVGPILAGSVKVRFGWAWMTVFMGVLCAVTAVPVGLFSGARGSGGGRDYTGDSEAGDDVEGRRGDV